MIQSVQDFDNLFFIGVAGTGMSALAQYMAGIGKNVSGSDRYFKEGETNETRRLLEQEGILCFAQDGTGITPATQLVVVSTAVEDTVPEVRKARELNIPILRRSELLALIADSRKTIAVGGTSGKSTTSGMIYCILEEAGLSPSIISGAGLVHIIRQGKIGNAAVGTGEWLIIEADESDGSIVQYHPEIGLLLNIDKDHQELDELIRIFNQFRTNTRKIFISNQNHPIARTLSSNPNLDFSADEQHPAGLQARQFQQEGLRVQFNVNEQLFVLNTVGRHNMENALAAIAVAVQLGVSLETCARALSQYEGIYRRHQIIGNANGTWLIDDYAHNPAKCAASIKACQPLAEKVIAWFQPHGYGPTRFLRHDFVEEIAAALRTQDEIWMSEIFYAGGTAVKDISAGDLINDLKALGKNAFFVADRNAFPNAIQSHRTGNDVLLLMGARDPSLETYATFVWNSINSL